MRYAPALILGLALAALPAACGSDSVKSPFGPGAGGGAGGEAGAQGNGGLMLDVDAGSEVDESLGGPCEDDGQCDDSVPCTVDGCDATLRRCRHVPDDSACANPTYCDGAERCDIRHGCVDGEAVSCSDNDTCTIDTCVEATQSCRHEPRDADSDGDPTHNCGGQDCDDTDPLVNSKAAEICGNSRDDDCDGQVDESDCVAPAYDTCQSALSVTEPGYYDVDLTATALDYPNDCASSVDGFRDAVLSLVVPAGGPFDVDVIAKLDRGKLVLATASACGDAKSASCVASFDVPHGGTAARVLLRGVTAGSLPLYVAADQEASVQVHVDWRAAQPQAGELCEDAVPLEAGGDPVTFRLAGYAKDASSACPASTGDAFATFTLEQAADVTLVAEAQDDLAIPVIALLDASCRSEVTCRHSQPGRLFQRGLPPGTYRVRVAGGGPDDVSLRLETAPVSDAPAGEGCAAALPLESGVESVVDLSNHDDAVNPRCLAGAPDATFAFELEHESDILLAGRFAAGDLGALSLTAPDCRSRARCSGGSLPPNTSTPLRTQRVIAHGLGAGSYRAVIESERGNPVALSWLQRPALTSVAVPFADNCDELIAIPEEGGSFSGNTANAFPDFDAGCDVGGQTDHGAPDQMLSLTLTRPRRVILDMQGSTYSTMLSVRQGQFCPGLELPLGCSSGFFDDSGRTQVDHGYLDLSLPAGDYFVQIDGYSGASGAWKLDVFTAPLP